MTGEQIDKVNETALELERMVNVMGSGETLAALAEKMTYMHRTLVQSFTSAFVIAFVRKMAENYKNGYYDGRDEAACKACAAMWDALLKQFNLDEEFISKYGFSLPLI